jgi:uncharacterized protein (DUF362 family)
MISPTRWPGSLTLTLALTLIAAAARATPDATTGASPGAWDGPLHAPAAGAATVDGAALRARHRARLAADTSPVTVLTGGTAEDLGRRLCEQVVPARPAATPILIKPNMGGFNWFHDPKTHHGDDGVRGRITDPEFVRGIIRCLKARGHTAITVADGFTGKPSDWQRLIKLSGYGAMATAEQVTLVALDDDGVFDVEGGKPGQPLRVTGMARTRAATLLIPKLVAETLDHGLFITAPKLKAHRFAVVSLGIKGLQGTTMYSDARPAFHQKGRSHRELDHALALIKAGDPGARAAYVKALEAFAERMTDILEVEAPDVELAEGAPAMSGDGFELLEPSPEPVAIGGTNVVAADRVGAAYLGLWDSPRLAKELGGHRTSPLIETAARRLGVDLTATKIVGDGAALLAHRRPGHLLGMANFTVTEPGDPAPTTPATPGPLRAARVTTAPTIDGDLDDAWAAAPTLTFTTDWAGHPTPIPTHVRALWSPRGLYLLWELEAVTPFTDTTRPIADERVDLYEENAVELFLALDPANRRRYAEIELGPYGHFFDLMVDLARKPSGDPKWSAHLRVATHRDDAARTARIEVAIEAPEVLAALAAAATATAHTELPLGLYRMEGRTRRAYLAAYPTLTKRPSFHVPEAFGTLILAP